MMLIPNRFIYFIHLTFCGKTFFCFLFLMIRKVVIIRLSHLTQCLITTSVDITFINLTTEYYVWKQLLTKSMSHSNLPRDNFYLFIYLFVYLFVCLFIYLFIYLFFQLKGCSPLFSWYGRLLQEGFVIASNVLLPQASILCLRGLFT